MRPNAPRSRPFPSSRRDTLIHRVFVADIGRCVLVLKWEYSPTFGVLANDLSPLILQVPIFGNRQLRRARATRVREPHPVSGDFIMNRTEIDEEAVLAEAKAGSYEAFEELMNRYEKRIYRFGLNITGSQQDAEDILQDTFLLKLFEHLAEFHEDSRFHAWIFRIALNAGWRKLRKQRSDNVLPLDGAQTEEEEFIPLEMTDWKPNPEQFLAESELEGILVKAAQSLPPMFRAVFLLQDVEKSSTEETASALDLGEATVKAFLLVARLHLRENLSQSFRN